MKTNNKNYQMNLYNIYINSNQNFWLTLKLDGHKPEGKKEIKKSYVK